MNTFQTSTGEYVRNFGQLLKRFAEEVREIEIENFRKFGQKKAFLETALHTYILQAGRQADCRCVACINAANETR